MAIHARIRQPSGAIEPVTLVAGMTIEQFRQAVAPAGIEVVDFFEDDTPAPDPNVPPNPEIVPLPVAASSSIPWWVWAGGLYLLLRR